MGTISIVSWIAESTRGSKVVVEFGAMFFDKLWRVDEGIKKIGIEIWGPYIENATFHDCKKIKGDMLMFEELLLPEEMDCALIVDALEHVGKEEGIDWIRRLQKSFNKIVLMVPEGEHFQDKDYFQMGADFYQTHRSTWWKEDLLVLGFQEIERDSNHHGITDKINNGALFAIWRKDAS